MKLKEYEKIVGESVVEEIRQLAEGLKDKRVVMINSTKNGGGVAEILSSLIPLLNELKIETEWFVLNGEKEFFEITKTFHNALQGEIPGDIQTKILNYEKFYLHKLRRLNRHIVDSLHDLSPSDIVVSHDPQPLNLIKYRKKTDGSKWIWRKHIDTTNPHMELWNYIYKIASNYDRIIVSKKDFVRGDRSKYTIFPPAIDPLTEKNRHLNPEEVKKILKKYNVPTDKPIITQVSRLDKWKDPLGVIDVYKEVKKKVDCRLALVYNTAADDPEGGMMEQEVISEKEGKNGEDILLYGIDSPLLVNALQTHSSMVFQKSLREGFALTVSEALWKQTPVIGSKVGGIPLQIEHGKNGFLVDGFKMDDNGNAVDKGERKLHIERASRYSARLLSHTYENEKMGRYGKEVVKNKFLITRLLKDYLTLFNSLYEKKKIDVKELAPIMMKRVKNKI